MNTLVNRKKFWKIWSLILTPIAGNSTSWSDCAGDCGWKVLCSKFTVEFMFICGYVYVNTSEQFCLKKRGEGGGGRLRSNCSGPFSRLSTASLFFNANKAKEASAWGRGAARSSIEKTRKNRGLWTVYPFSGGLYFKPKTKRGETTETTRKGDQQKLSGWPE